MGKITTKDSDNNSKKSSKKRDVENSSKNGSIDTTADVDINKLIIRQQETCTIIEQKKDLLVSNQLSYLEYVELQEEIGRLNELRDYFQGKINALRKNRKKNDASFNK